MNDTAREIFIKNFNYYLEKSGLSKSEIANILNISKSSVSEWANGNRYPRVDAMQNLADVFGIPMSQLTGDSDDDDVTKLRQRLKDDPAYRMLFKLADGATSEDIMKAVKILKALKDDE